MVIPFEMHLWDFSGGPVIENLPSNAGAMGLIPGQGTKIPHASGQLRLQTATREKPTRRKEDRVWPKLIN